jgi:5-methylcytosine-specific restriction endonuclease McrA
MSLDIYLSKIFQDENTEKISFVKNKQVSAQQVSAQQVSAQQVSAQQVSAQEETKARPTARRRQLPASVRDSVWNNYIGEDINKHRCLCCKKGIITNRYFHVGHVISLKNGGTDEINNLRPICPPCNHSMGTTNMVEFVQTYGYYVG